MPDIKLKPAMTDVKVKDVSVKAAAPDVKARAVIAAQTAARSSKETASDAAARDGKAAPGAFRRISRDTLRQSQQAVRRVAVFVARDAAQNDRQPEGGNAYAVQQSEQMTRYAAVAAKDKVKAVDEARRDATRRLWQRSLPGHMAAEQRAKMLHRAKEAAARIVRSAAAGIGAALAGVGLVPVLLGAILLVAILASPFGILMANESTDGMPIRSAVAAVNYAFTQRLQEGDYAEVTVTGQTADWADVLAVFAAKTALGEDGMDVATMDEQRLALLQGVYDDMTEVETEPRTVTRQVVDAKTGKTIVYDADVLYVTLRPKTAEQAAAEYGFSAEQLDAMRELLAMDDLKALLADLAASDAQARDVLARLPLDTGEQRRAVVETACSLVGKVTYFWGGKSLVVGWDSRWGTPTQVWAEGSPSTGTVRPYGLDCSGFVDWVFYNASGGETVLSSGGGATAQHRACTAIRWADAQPGDLVFYPGDEHCGIVVGRDEDGKLLIAHCASGPNGTVITGAEGFTAIGRPRYYEDG